MDTKSPPFLAGPPALDPAPRHASAAPANDGSPAPHGADLVVPIRSMGPGHRDRILSHLLGLDERDRYLRFGYLANDEQIGRYVAGLNFERDALLGIFNRRMDLIAMAHLAFSVDPTCMNCAEFGVSVSKSARGRGFGTRLFERCTVNARNEGVEMFFVHALSENTAMLAIARKAGATVVREGSESEAHLRLPPADFDSRMSEIIDENVALTDYHLKQQAHHFWNVLGFLQRLRQGVRDARARLGG